MTGDRCPHGFMEVGLCPYCNVTSTATRLDALDKRIENCEKAIQKDAVDHGAYALTTESDTLQSKKRIEELEALVKSLEASSKMHMDSIVQLEKADEKLEKRVEALLAWEEDHDAEHHCQKTAPSAEEAQDSQTPPPQEPEPACPHCGASQQFNSRHDICIECHKSMKREPEKITWLQGPDYAMKQDIDSLRADIAKLQARVEEVLHWWCGSEKGYRLVLDDIAKLREEIRAKPPAPPAAGPWRTDVTEGGSSNNLYLLITENGRIQLGWKAADSWLRHDMTKIREVVVHCSPITLPEVKP